MYRGYEGNIGYMMLSWGHEGGRAERLKLLPISVRGLFDVPSCRTL